MHVLWMFHRRLLVTVAVVSCVGASVALMVAASQRGDPRTGIGLRAHRSTGAAPSAADVIHSRSPGRPSTATTHPPLSAVQEQIDAELARAVTPASISAAQQSTVPTPAASAAYPSIPAVDRSDPSAYVLAFATELLDTDYATESRAELLAWAEHEEAPNTLPGVPASVAGKALVLSLADPDIPGATPSPTPSAAQWASDGQRGEVQSVSDLQVEVDPDWTQIISEGWQPADARMTIEVVTGTMTISTDGQAAPPQSFSLTVTLGTAAHVRSGYGAVAVGDWTLN
jgi:hypothetical protein